MRVAFLYFTDFLCNVFVGCWIDLFVAKWQQMAPEVDHWEPLAFLGAILGALDTVLDVIGLLWAPFGRLRLSVFPSGSWKFGRW